MKKILFTVGVLVVLLSACKPGQPQPEPATLADVQQVNERDSALLSQADIMVIYYHGYASALSHAGDPGTLKERWALDSLRMVDKIQRLLIK